MKYKIFQSEKPNFWVDSSKKDYNKEEYNMVYEYADESEKEELEKVFEIFNIAKPEDYKGHSLSVGDIVEVENTGKVYICGIIGWIEVNWK